MSFEGNQSRTSSSAQLVGDMTVIHCGGCGKSNGPERKFCSQCGQSLWCACEKCGELYAMGESFCGSCGVNLATILDDKVAAFESQLQRAEELRAAFEYPEAIALLQSLTRETDGRLASYVARVRTRLTDVQREMATATARAEAALHEAKQLTKSNAFEGIIGVLSEIPEPLRTDEMQALLRVADSRRKDILSLSGDIRAALESGQVLALMPKLDRLLQLIPDHEQAKTLGFQVRDKLVHVAKQKLAKHQYREAHATLVEIAPFAQTEEIQNLMIKTNELVWLSDGLRSSPIVDPVLLVVADRLLKHAPSNQPVAGICEQLKARAGSRAKDRRFPALPWAKTPKHCHLGMPIDLVGGSNTISGWSELSSKHHLEFPSSFQVACGLALQGVGRGHLDTNLVPKKKSLLSNLGLVGKGMSFRRKKPERRTAWGIDLGGSSLKAVKLVCDEQTGAMVVQACERIEYTRSLSQAADANQEREILKQALEVFTSRETLGESDKICVSIRGTGVLARFVKIPPVDDKNLEKTVAYEVANQIPYPIDELGWDFQQMTEQKDANDQRRVLLLAAKLTTIQERLRLFEDVKIRVDILQGETVALYNFVLHEFFKGEKYGSDGMGDESNRLAENEVVAIVDIGSDLTNVVIGAEDLLSFRSLPTGGNQFTNALLKPFNVTFQQAEQLKFNPSKVRSFRRLYEEFQRVFVNLAGEIERSVAAFNREHPDRKIRRLFVTGGGVQLHGMMRCLVFGPDHLDGSTSTAALVNRPAEGVRSGVFMK